MLGGDEHERIVDDNRYLNVGHRHPPRPYYQCIRLFNQKMYVFFDTVNDEGERQLLLLLLFAAILVDTIEIYLQYRVHICDRVPTKTLSNCYSLYAEF